MNIDICVKDKEGLNIAMLQHSIWVQIISWYTRRSFFSYSVLEQYQQQKVNVRSKRLW